MDDYRVNPLDYITLPDNFMPVCHPDSGLPKKSYMLFLCERITKGGMEPTELQNRIMRAFHIMFTKHQPPTARPKYSHWGFDTMQVGEVRFALKEDVTAVRQAAWRAGKNNPGMKFSVRKPDMLQHGPVFRETHYAITRIA